MGWLDDAINVGKQVASDPVGTAQKTVAQAAGQAADAANKAASAGLNDMAQNAANNARSKWQSLVDHPELRILESYPDRLAATWAQVGVYRQQFSITHNANWQVAADIYERIANQQFGDVIIAGTILGGVAVGGKLAESKGSQKSPPLDGQPSGIRSTQAPSLLDELIEFIESIIQGVTK